MKSDTTDLAGAVAILAKFDGFNLHKISATTYHRDIEVRNRGSNKPDALSVMLRSGNAYRCRILKGPFFYGATATAAAEAAAKHSREALDV